MALSVDDYGVLKSDNTSNSFVKYISKKLNDIPRSCSGVVLLLPDLDIWPVSLQSSGSTQADDPQESEQLNGNTNIYSFLFNAVKHAFASRPVCVLATSTESTDILKHRDLRNLFYRKILVSLPSGDQRYRLLMEEMRICSNQTER